MFISEKIVSEKIIGEPNPKEPKAQEARNEPPPLINAFEKNSGAPLPSWYIELPPPIPSPVTITTPPPETQKPSFTDLSKIAQLVFPQKSPPKAPELLPLPKISDGELSIDNEKGISNFSDYINYFAKNSTFVKFPYEKYLALKKTSEGEVFLPTALIDKALKEKNFARIRDGLSLAEEFLGNKVSYMKAIKVRGEAVEVSRKMVGLEMLTLDLIRNTRSFDQGKMSEQEFLAFYGKYKKTTEFYNREFTTKSGILALSKKDGLFYRIGELLGIKPLLARAFLLPFGGIITYVERTQCACTGMLVTVGPPAGGLYFLYWAVYSSPAIYLYKAIHETANILGTYIPAAGYCGVPEAYCAGSIIGNGAIGIAGTSP